MLRDIMLYNYKWILRRRKKKRNYSWISFAIILSSSGIKLKSFGKIEMARFTPERSPRLALEDARLTFRATPCDAHVPIFFRTIAQTRGHRLTQPANSFEIHRSWKSLDRIQFAGREERKKERKKVKKPRRFFSTFQWTSVEKNAALGTERKRVMSCAWNRSELLVHRKWIPTKEVERNDWSHLHATRTTRQLVAWMDPWNYRYFGNQEYNVFKKIR